MQRADVHREGERIFTICNACRYCEGFCAVFPAMEKLTAFSKEDVEYLANLCHNCGECYDACQYAPPHEFAVDVPEVLAQVREQGYKRRPLLLMASVSLGAMLAAMWVSEPSAEAGFYGVISYESMVAAFGVLGVFAVVALVSSYPRHYWRGWQKGAKDVAKLTYLGGPRRWFHQATFYGFLLCLASTTSAAFYRHVLGMRAPYDYLSVPVILGTVGGLGLLIGPVGLLFLKPRDVTFIATLIATSLTGLALMALRETAAMAPLLYVHLGVVAMLFLTMPYGKFLHGVYRSAALIRYAVERHAGK